MWSFVDVSVGLAGPFVEGSGIARCPVIESLVPCEFVNLFGFAFAFSSQRTAPFTKTRHPSHGMRREHGR